MRKLALILLLSTYSYADGNTCVQTAPPTAPKAKILVIKLNPDGGTSGCTVRASGDFQGAQEPHDYTQTNAKCLQATNIANQALANDNGWADGGAP